MKPENYGEFVEDTIKCCRLYINSGNIFDRDLWLVSMNLV